MAVVISEFESIPATAPPAPAAAQKEDAAQEPPKPKDVERILRQRAERYTRVRAT
jgi:ribosomal protein L12E/L44/L45/RPP1/RPP2